MDDVTWRMVFRVLSALSLLAITFGIPLGCILAYKAHRSQTLMLNSLLLWVRDAKLAAVTPPPQTLSEPPAGASESA